MVLDKPNEIIVVYNDVSCYVDGTEECTEENYREWLRKGAKTLQISISTQVNLTT